MRLRDKLLAIAVASATALLLATPASAIPFGEKGEKADRTWVSGFGDNYNPCSRIYPCKTFERALERTADGGEIDCLDAGGFGPVTITKAVTIDCSAAGHLGGVNADGKNGIVVNPGAGVYVQLNNLDINGLGDGYSGVLVESGIVAIANSTIYGFQGGSNCGITGGTGVCVNGPTGTKVTLDNTTLRNNTIGVVDDPTAGVNTVIVHHSVLDGNVTANAQTSVAGAKMYLDGDILINCPTAVANPGGVGLVATFGNNAITGSVPTLAFTALK